MVSREDVREEMECAYDSGDPLRIWRWHIMVLDYIIEECAGIQELPTGEERRERCEMLRHLYCLGKYQHDSLEDTGYDRFHGDIIDLLLFIPQRNLEETRRQARALKECFERFLSCEGQLRSMSARELREHFVGHDCNG